MSADASKVETIPQARLAWWAGLAIALTAVNLRTAVTGLPPLFEIIGAQLGFGVPTAGLLGTVPAASFAVFGLLAPTVTRRFGLERTAAAALGLTAAALLLRALSQGTLVLVVSTVLALAGIGAANVVIVPLIKAWFPRRIAAWTSAYLLLLQAGQFIAPLVAVPMADTWNWRVSVGVWALPAAMAAAVWLVLTTKLSADHYAATTAVAPGARLRIARSSTVWGLTVLFATTASANYGIVTWLPGILGDAGAGEAFGGTMVALYSAWGVLAALLIPQLAIRMVNPFVVVVVCVALLVGGLLGLEFAPMHGTLAWVCALGIGVSTFPLCLTLINKRTRTPQSASVASGFVQGIGYGLACLVPIGLGLLRQATGSWSASVWVLVATAVPAVVGGWFACRPRYIDDEDGGVGSGVASGIGVGSASTGKSVA